MSNTSSTRVLEVLACCPPGPPEPVKRHSSSDSGICTTTSHRVNPPRYATRPPMRNLGGSHPAHVGVTGYHVQCFRCVHDRVDGCSRWPAPLTNGAVSVTTNKQLSEATTDGCHRRRYCRQRFWFRRPRDACPRCHCPRCCCPRNAFPERGPSRPLQQQRGMVFSIDWWHLFHGMATEPGVGKTCRTPPDARIQTPALIRSRRHRSTVQAAAAVSPTAASRTRTGSAENRNRVDP